jgi:AcrR family transcriptional regulator
VQRSRLLDAGVQVVAEVSYENTGIKAICQRAGVAYNAFYEYFESKEDLLVEAYEVGAQSMLVALAEAYAACTGSWEEQVRAAINRFLHVLVENPPFARFFTIEAPKVGRSIADHVRLTVAAVPALFVGISPAPTLPMENEELLPFVVGSVSAGISTYVQSGQEHKLMDLEDQFVALICTLYTSETSTSTSIHPSGLAGA